jgi:hypothetical protein
MPRYPWCRCRPCVRTPQAQPLLLGHHLHDRPGVAVLGGPGPLLESAHDHDPAALGQRLRGVLGLVTPHDHGEELVEAASGGSMDAVGRSSGTRVARTGQLSRVATTCGVGW